jgi:hypothetical protein
MLEGQKRKRLEERRRDTLSEIRGERLSVEEMAQRAQQAGDTPDAAFLETVYERLAEIEQLANKESHIDEFKNLSGDAEKQGQLRAYICPRAEIFIEGSMSIDLIEEWKVPTAVIAKLRGVLSKYLEKADTETEVARGALRAIFEERDSWANYTEDYEDTLKNFTWGLSGAFVLTLLAAITVLLSWPSYGIFSVLLAGAAGSCVSVMAKMPMLEVSLSGELEAYQRRILSRISVGVLSSVIGSGMLGWGLLPISIQGKTFTNALNACTSSPATLCTALDALLLLAIPMLLGFSERALTSFEGQIFSHSKDRQTSSE